MEIVAILAQTTVTTLEDREKTQNESIVSKTEKVKTRTLDSAPKQEANTLSLVGRRVSQVDILILFIEILKLFIKSREQEVISRRMERACHIMHMEEVVDNYKSNGSKLFGAYLGAGILGIFSAAMPVIGHAWGGTMKNAFSYLMPSVQTMPTDKFVESATKMTSTFSQMQRHYGEINNTFSQGNRTLNQYKGDLYKTDSEEETRAIEKNEEARRNIENFLIQMLQQEHDTARTLLNQN